MTTSGLLRMTHMETPIGPLRLVGDASGLQQVSFQVQDAPDPHWKEDSAFFAAARTQLTRYFGGEAVTFDLPLRPLGTPFQERVWEALQTIPYGETVSYGEIARQLNPPSSPRAVGGANGRNPIAVIIPCHRVIGGTGALVGYTGGLAIKRALLALEHPQHRLV